MNSIKLDDLKSHIEELASSNNIEIAYKSNYGGSRAWRKSKKIKINPIKSRITYAIALHELGHILGRQPKHRIDRELSAWKWAVFNAKLWDKTMSKTMVKSLQSYIRWANRRKGAIRPDEGHEIFQWISMYS